MYEINERGYLLRRLNPCSSMASLSASATLASSSGASVVAEDTARDFCSDRGSTLTLPLRPKPPGVDFGVLLLGFAGRGLRLGLLPLEVILADPGALGVKGGATMMVSLTRGVGCLCFVSLL